MALDAAEWAKAENALTLADRRLPGWTDRVNTPLKDRELESMRRSVQRGRPWGDENWVESIARRLNLESTMRPRGRPKKARIEAEERRAARHKET